MSDFPFTREFFPSTIPSYPDYCYEGQLEGQGDYRYVDCRSTNPSFDSSLCLSCNGMSDNKTCAGSDDYCQSNDCGPSPCFCTIKEGFVGTIAVLGDLRAPAITLLCSRYVVPLGPALITQNLSVSSDDNCDRCLSGQTPLRVSATATIQPPVVKLTISLSGTPGPKGTDVQEMIKLPGFSYGMIPGDSNDFSYPFVGCVPALNVTVQRIPNLSNPSISYNVHLQISGPDMCGAFSRTNKVNGIYSGLAGKSSFKIGDSIYTPTPKMLDYAKRVRSLGSTSAVDNQFTTSDDGTDIFVIYPNDSYRVVSYSVSGVQGTITCKTKVCKISSSEVCIPGQGMTIVSYMDTYVTQGNATCPGIRPTQNRQGKAKSKDQCVDALLFGRIPVTYECTNWVWSIAYLLIVAYVGYYFMSYAAVMLCLFYPLFGIAAIIWSIFKFIWDLPATPFSLWVSGKITGLWRWFKGGFVKPSNGSTLLVIMLLPLALCYEPYSTTCTNSYYVESTPIENCVGGIETCPVKIDFDGDILYPGYVSCQNIGLGGSVKLTLYAEWVNATLVISMSHDYSTANFSVDPTIMTDSVLRCSGEGICSGSKCDDSQLTDYTCGGKFHVDTVTNYPGVTTCGKVHSDDTHGCVSAGDPCVCSRATIVPEAPYMDAYAFSSSQVLPIVKLTLYDNVKGVVIDQQYVSGITQADFGNFTYASTGISVDYSTYFDGKMIYRDVDTGKSFYGAGCAKGAPVATLPGDNQADSVDVFRVPSSTMNPDAFATASGMFTRTEAKGKGVYTILPSGMSLIVTYPVLPVTIAGNTFSMSAPGQMVSSLLNPGTLSISVQYPSGYMISVEETLICPNAPNSGAVIQGCYACDAGATVQFTANSACGAGPGNISPDTGLPLPVGSDGGPLQYRLPSPVVQVQSTPSVISFPIIIPELLKNPVTVGDITYNMAIAFNLANTAGTQGYTFTAYGNLVSATNVNPRNSTFVPSQGSGSSSGGGVGIHIKNFFKDWENLLFGAYKKEVEIFFACVGVAFVCICAYEIGYKILFMRAKYVKVEDPVPLTSIASESPVSRPKRLRSRKSRS